MTSPSLSLAHRLRADDALALARLVDLTYGRCLAVARTLHASDAAAERAVLDAYVALWLARRELPEGAGEARLEAWLASTLVAAASAGSPERAWAVGGWVRRSLARRLAALRARWAARSDVAPLAGVAGVPCP